MGNPIRVDISATHHLGHRGCARGSGENDSGNLFVLSFLLKDKNPLTHRKNSKYDADQDGRTGPTESSDVSKGEIPKLSVVKRGTDYDCEGGGGHSPTPTTYICLGKKGITGRKTRKLRTKPNSRV